MKTFSLSDLNRQSGEVVDAALVSPVGLTKRGKRRLVLMNAEVYEVLVHGKAFRIEDAPDAVHAMLMEGLKEALTDS